MGQPHVVIFPYNEQGHVNPAFALGRALASKGIAVTCVVTATRYANIRSSRNSGSGSSLFRVEAIDDSGGDGDGDVCFQHSLQKLEPAFQHLMLHLQPRPSCLIADVLYPWSHNLADSLALPHFQFCVHLATSYLIGFHFSSLIAQGLLPFQPGMEDEVIDFIPGLKKGYRLGDLPMDLLGRDIQQLEVVRRINCTLKKGVGVVFNTVYELEQDALDALSAEGLSVYAVGPMSNMDWEHNHHCDVASLFTEDEECLHWLDSQPHSSVVYVAVGSINSLSQEEIQEVALGLEACGQPFLWVIRHSSCNDGSTDPNLSALPQGFLERTKERGRIVPWVPQAAVLFHPSTGCFLIGHCGLGSAIEALWAGVPMIAGSFYKISDQNTVFRFLTEDWGVAIALQDQKVACAGSTTSLRCAIESCVKEVMHGPTGSTLTHKAMHLKAALRQAIEPGGSSHLDLNKLVHALNKVSPDDSPLV